MARFSSTILTPGAMALQIWEILTRDAQNRHTPTYIEIARKVGYRWALPIIPSLYRILHCCLQEGLPILSGIVINKNTGLPGPGLAETGTVVTHENFLRIREEIFRYDWSSAITPTPDDFERAYKIGRHKHR